MSFFRRAARPMPGHQIEQPKAKPPGSNKARMKREQQRASAPFAPSRELLKYRAEIAAAEAAFEGGPTAGDALARGQQIIDEVRIERETRRKAHGGRVEPVRASAVVPNTEPAKRAGPPMLGAAERAHPPPASRRPT